MVEKVGIIVYNIHSKFSLIIFGDDIYENYRCFNQRR